jgi:hypothetical protein
MHFLLHDTQVTDKALGPLVICTYRLCQCFLVLFSMIEELFSSITHGICVKCVFSFSSYCRADQIMETTVHRNTSVRVVRTEVELSSRWPLKSLNDEINASTLLKGVGVEVTGVTRQTLMLRFCWGWKIVRVAINKRFRWVKEHLIRLENCSAVPL